jgi:hypothetical protein
MAKKNSKTERRPPSPKPTVRQEDTAYLVREDLDEQQERLGKAEAAGAGAVRTPAPPSPVEQPPAPAMVPLKPLTPLASLWPDQVPPKAESRASQLPTPQLQKASIAVTVSKPAPAPAAPSPPPPIQPPPSKSPEKAVVAASATKPTAPQTLGVSFALHKPDAKRVLLCGEFNGWSPTATPMTRPDDGHWEVTIALVPGRYQYKFIVDGEWIADPAAQKNVPNEHGSLNSVVEVRA